MIYWIAFYLIVVAVLLLFAWIYWQTLKCPDCDSEWWRERKKPFERVCPHCGRLEERVKVGGHWQWVAKNR